MVLVYEPNAKHKEPWQMGRNGTLCPHWPGLDPARMLQDSIQYGGKRFSTYNGMAFVAQRHMVRGDTEYWHGYPEGWENIPSSIRHHWRHQGVITQRQIRQFWSRSNLESE